MSDAVCGPSNPLQQFKQQSQLDRTLQQDRLTSRHSPAQGFRSPDPNVGLLDPEFEAFQAGLPAPDLPQYHQQQFPPPSFAGPAQTPSWAADFQNMHISPSPFPQQHAPPAGPASSNWAQGFKQHIAQTAPRAQNSSPSPLAFQQRARYGMNGFQSHFQQPSYVSPNVQSKGKEPVREEFDDAAFERAFDQAREDMMMEEGAMSEGVETQVPDARANQAARMQDLHNIISNYAEASGTELGSEEEHAARVEELLQKFSSHETEGVQQAASQEDKLRTLEDYQNIHSHDNAALRQAGSRENQAARLEDLQNMSLDFDDISGQDVLSHDGLLNDDSLALQDALDRQEEAQDTQTNQQQEDDALAATAQELLEKVEHNQTDKFRNSQFLGLMRKLRDREVKVEGDKMVETAGPSTVSSSTTAEDLSSLNAASTTTAPLRFDNTEQRPAPLDGAQRNAGTVDTRPPDYGIPAHEQDHDLGRTEMRDGQEVVDLLNQRGALVDDIGTSFSLPAESLGAKEEEEENERIRRELGFDDPRYFDRFLDEAREEMQRNGRNDGLSEMLYGPDGTLAQPIAWRAAAQDADLPIKGRRSS